MSSEQVMSLCALMYEVKYMSTNRLSTTAIVSNRKDRRTICTSEPSVPAVPTNNRDNNNNNNVFI